MKGNAKKAAGQNFHEGANRKRKKKLHTVLKEL